MNLIFSLFLLAPFTALYAQQSSQDLNQPAPTQSTERIERLEVTGSYIQRIDLEGPSPLEMLNRDEFLQSGSITLSDVLKLNPSFEAVYEGSGHVRFRGQHAGNVLILLNGMRLPKLNGGYYTSINGLPTSVIERVEMLKDGGSALYGSDAMSGVMNFRTRRNYDGAEIQATSTVAESGVGTQTSYVATFGRSHSRGNTMGVIQFEQADAYGESDVGSFNNATDVAPVNTTNARLGSLNIGPQCADGSTCESDPLLYREVRPKNQDLTALVTTSYEFTEIDVNLLAMFNRRESTSSGSPLRLNWTDERWAGGANNAIPLSEMQPSPLRDRIVNDNLVDSNGLINLSGSFADEIGTQVRESQDDNLTVQADVKGYMGSSTWTWNAQAGYAQLTSERQIIRGEVNQEALKELFRRGEFDPTAQIGAKSNVSSAYLQPTYRNDGQMISGKAVLSGEVFNLGDWYNAGGLVSMALGVESQWETFAFDNDPSLVEGLTLSSASRNYDGQRSVQSAFMELSAYPVQNLEVQLAHRFDHYSDVGNTYNPKLALAYTPRKEILLRSSIGTGFRAPGITDLYAGSQDSIQRFRDQATCPTSGSCSSRFYDVTTFTDQDLESETSLHYSAGAVIQPTRNLSISLDQWNFEGENTLSAIRAEEFTDIERRFGPSALDGLGVSTTRDADGNLVRIEHPGVMNMGTRELRGLDASVDYRFDLSKESSWRVNLTAAHSLIFERNTKKFDFDEVEKGESQWKNRLSIGLSNDNHFTRLTALTVSSGQVGVGAFEQKLPQYTEFDFTYSYTAFWGGKFSLAVRNLANTRPPVRDDGELVTYASLDRNYSSFSPLRRRFFLGYSQSF